jgi:hypothetical protein
MSSAYAVQLLEQSKAMISDLLPLRKALTRIQRRFLFRLNARTRPWAIEGLRAAGLLALGKKL